MKHHFFHTNKVSLSMILQKRLIFTILISSCKDLIPTQMSGNPINKHLNILILAKDTKILHQTKTVLKQPKAKTNIKESQGNRESISADGDKVN